MKGKADKLKEKQQQLMQESVMLTRTNAMIQFDLINLRKKFRENEERLISLAGKIELLDSLSKETLHEEAARS